MDTKELKELSIALMDAVKQRGVSVFEVKTADFKLHIELSGAAAPAAASRSTDRDHRSRGTTGGNLCRYTGGSPTGWRILQRTRPRGTPIY